MKQVKNAVAIAAMMSALLVEDPLLASAAEYPTQPIKLIVAFPAGGSTDVLARRVAEPLSRRLGQKIIIENRPGASGAIGMRIAAAAKPDGYTLAVCNSGTHGGNPVLMREPGYDALKDFSPVVRVSAVPFILVASPRLPVNSVSDLIALAKTQPRRLKIGFTAVGSYNHIVGELFQLQTNTEFVAVQYKGLNEVITDVAGGHIDLGFPTPGESTPMIASGRLRPLMVTGTKRLPLHPAVPTAKEVGMGEVVMLGWGGLCVPAGTPSTVIKVINAQTLATILSEPLRGELEKTGYELGANTPEEFGEFMRTEIQRIETLVKQRGIQAEQ